MKDNVELLHIHGGFYYEIRYYLERDTGLYFYETKDRIKYRTPGGDRFASLAEMFWYTFQEATVRSVKEVSQDCPWYESVRFQTENKRKENEL